MDPEEDEEINDAPVEQVRLTVPITDDKTMPALTFRTWLLGLPSCVLLASLTQFFGFRKNNLSPPSELIILLVLPLGRLMAASLPSRQFRIGRWTFSLNPGPFSVKEHYLISVIAYSGLSAPYSLVIVSQMKAFFHRQINPWAALLVAQTSQLLGYGLVGFFVKLFVESPYMWWPTILPSVTFYRTFHDKDTREERKLTRLQFFAIASISSFAYYVFPNYFFPSISNLSLVCWIWKDSVTAQQLGSAIHGLGLGSFGLDWATAASFVGSPLVLPFSVILNMMAGFLLLVCIITPIAYWTNSFDAKRFPIFSSDLFDADGNSYNVSRVVDAKRFVFDEDGYDKYSKIYITPSYAYAQGFSFAAVTASLTHAALFHGRSTWEQLKEACSRQDQMSDVHTRVMKRNYASVPNWWFHALLITTLGFAIFTCEGFGRQLQLPFWGVLLGLLLALIFVIPIGILQATAGQGIALNIVTELILGYLYPGKPLAYLTFKSYGMTTLANTLSFLSDFKLGYYLKIPPKSLFFAEVIGMIVSSSVNFGVTWWLLTSVEHICDLSKLPKGSPWTCPDDHVANSLILIWGLAGPQRLFAPYGRYGKMYIFFAVGVLGPAVVRISTLVFPNVKWIGLINVPVILLAGAHIPPARAVHYWTWFPVGFFFSYVVYRKYKGWWAKYNYLLSSALSTGLSLMAFLTSISLQNGIYGVDWWGLSVDDHCPLARCPTAPGVQVDGCPAFS